MEKEQFLNLVDVKLVEKWKPLLEGIKGEYKKRVCAQLLENQAKSVLNEQKELLEAANYTAATTVGKLGTFQKFAFPLVRRIFPRLIANELVGVQPMQGPTSQIFYLGWARSKNGGGGANTQQVFSKYNLTYQGLTTSAIFPGANLNIVSGAWNGSAGTLPGQFPLSSLLSGTNGSPSSTFGGKIASWPESTRIYGISVSAGEVLAGTEIPELNMTIEQQPVVARTRKMRALWTMEANQDLKAYHNIDLESELTSLLDQELRLEIDRELIEDLRMIAYDVTGAFGGFERRMLDMANSNNFPTDNAVPAFAPGNWMYELSALPSNPAGNLKNVFLCDLTSGGQLNLSPRHVGEVYSNLLACVNFASQDIFKTTHRGRGTWLLTSPLIGAMLESAAKLEGGIKESDGPSNMGHGIEFRGKFAGIYDLFIDPLYPEDEILMGYKGSNAMDAGYVYAPYIPLQQLPTVIDPETFQPRKGIMTRYGKCVVAPESRFYRIIRIIGQSANYLFTPFAKNTGSNVPYLNGI